MLQTIETMAVGKTMCSRRAQKETRFVTHRAEHRSL